MKRISKKIIQTISKFVNENPEAGFTSFKGKNPKFKHSSAAFKFWKRRLLKEPAIIEKPKRSYVRKVMSIDMPKEWLTSEDKALIEKVKNLPESERSSCYQAIAKAAYLLNDVKNKVVSYDLAKSLT